MVIARMGSTRVPGKALLDIAGKPVVARVIDIARTIPGVDEVTLLTSELVADDPIAALGAAMNVPVVRGHPEYVLDRIVKAIAERGAEVVVYVGGDCPLLDPVMLGEAIRTFFALGCDYLNNYDPPTFPEGFDVNVLTKEAVLLAHKMALAPSQRIHAFSYLSRHPGACHIENYAGADDLSAHHWSLDFPEDLEFQRLVYARLGSVGRAIRIADILELIERDPEVAALDRRLQRPPVAHAFWNSPGIIRDMNADIAALAEMAWAAFAEGDRARTHRCYEEIVLIADELARFSAGT